MEEEMHVGVDQAGHQRRIAQIDGLRPGGVVDGGAGRNNLLSFNEHFSGRNNTPAFDVEQAGGVENDWMRSSRGLCQGKRPEEETSGKKAREADAANLAVSSVVSSIDRQDGCRISGVRAYTPRPYYYGPQCGCAEGSARSPPTSKTCATFWPRPALTARVTHWLGLPRRPVSSVPPRK